jgi:hypothetical protein
MLVNFPSSITAKLKVVKAHNHKHYPTRPKPPFQVDRVGLCLLTAVTNGTTVHSPDET